MQVQRTRIPAHTCREAQGSTSGIRALRYVGKDLRVGVDYLGKRRTRCDEAQQAWEYTYSHDTLTWLRYPSGFFPAASRASLSKETMPVNVGAAQDVPSTGSSRPWQKIQKDSPTVETSG